MAYETSVSAYDALAPRFDRDRVVPDGVPQAIRLAVLAAAPVARPMILDLGAGTGRIGWPFVAAGDDYVGADLSFGMLRDSRRAVQVRPDSSRPMRCGCRSAMLLSMS